ncbi:MAG: helix-turn-helix transcriptional regulator [Alteromonadaceae bacterium]|nr:helix-turn-helix transcriptional regulator [Alteromonadaceae bacterium]
MDISMKINSEKVRELRNNKGWSQEQLSVFSGLSLRTIQRIESEGKISRESKVCLAATFDIDLNELDFFDVFPINSIKVAPYKPNKIVISVGLLSIILSMIGYLFFSEPSYIFLTANMICISSIIHSLLDWYFSESERISSVLKRSVRVTFIYLFCYLTFSLIGEQSAGTLLNGLVSGLIFGVVYYFIDLRFSVEKNSKSISTQA